MEDSFNVRVGKIFGSLSSSSSAATSSSLSSSLWCLTDDEVERQHWSREKSTPEVHEDLQDLDDEDEDEDEDGEGYKDKDDEPESKNDDSDWDIKACIGLDCTLDYEEEEDEYDKVAVGNDKPEDRVYMRDVQDYGIDIDSRFQIPVSLEEADRDPRANHLAAKIRLKEDSDVADLNPKSILKRKDNLSDSKSSKRVRFDPGCVGHHPEQFRCGGDHERDRNPASAVPDYMLNPSRYTRYTFDSSSSDDADEHSNKRAYMDFLKTLNKSVADASFDPAKPVTFIPRKKTTGDTSAMVDSCTELVQQVGIGKDAQRRIAAADAQLCGMEEDDPPQPMPSRKGNRQYRVKPRPEFHE